ncbi:hypothetical protein H7U20_05165, partial [Rugamonas sp. CCM 8940]|uniref:hypothetical protein n=1 Tax=Rugamonas sp. CCM 8940 TaxID=2765359 RepID=UPI001A1C513E|nr:hypothetical protein [Rugamonas sp. CCM 8940]
MIKFSFSALLLGVTVAASAPVGAAQVLMAETQLENGQYLTTRSGLYSVVVQGDGNVVEYFNTRMGTRPSQFSTGRGRGNHLRMQMDGNLALYTSGGTWAWTSETGGRPYNMGYKLVLYETGALFIHDANNNVVKILSEADRPNSQGGPVDRFPFRKIVNGACQDMLTPDFQSGMQAVVVNKVVASLHAASFTNSGSARSGLSQTSS